MFSIVEEEIFRDLFLREVIDIRDIRTGSVIIDYHMIERVGNLVGRIKFGATTIQRIHFQHCRHVLVIPGVVLWVGDVRTSKKRSSSVIAHRVVGSSHKHIRKRFVDLHVRRCRSYSILGARLDCAGPTTTYIGIVGYPTYGHGFACRGDDFGHALAEITLRFI